MSFKSFSIESIGPLERVKCEQVPPLMILAGPNGVGKSTLLEKLYELLQGKKLENCNIKTKGEVKALYFSPYRAPSPAPFKKALLPYLPKENYQEFLSRPDFQVSAPPQSYSDELRGLFQYRTKRSRLNADPAPYFGAKKRLVQLEEEKRNILSDIYEREGKVPEGALPNILEPFENAIKEVLPGIQFIEIDIEEDDYKIYFKNRLDKKVEFSHLSSGEKDTIVMLLLLVEDEVESNLTKNGEATAEDLVMLIDSPEAYLHPTLQQRFLDYAQRCLEKGKKDENKRNIQLIISTHSKMLLDHSNAKQIYFLLFPDQVQNNQLKSGEFIDENLLQTISGELGFAALSTGKPMLFVEGKSDKELLTILYPELREKFEIEPMGGKKEISKLEKAFNSLFPKLSSLGVEVFSIRDSDREMSLNNEVKERVFVLSRTCIENYLLDFEGIYQALLQLVNHEKLDQKGIDSSDRVENKIYEVIRNPSFQNTELKTRINEKMTFTINVRDLAKINAQSIQNKIAEVASTKKERIVRDIQEVEDKLNSAIRQHSLDKLSGKLILHELAKEFDIDSEDLAKSIAGSIAASNKEIEDLDEIIEKIMTSTN